MDSFFDKVCPKCKSSLHLMKIVAEPVTNQAWLGTVVFACFKCSVTIVTEPVTEKQPYLQPAHFKRMLKKADYTEIIKLYQDILSFINPFMSFITLASHNSALSERAIHIMSAMFAYLAHIKAEIESQLPPRPKELGDGK